MLAFGGFHRFAHLCYNRGSQVQVPWSNRVFPQIERSRAGRKSMKAHRSTEIRHSTKDGTWYPGTRESLARTVDGYLSNVGQPLLEGELLGLISPHAGYAYSGQTAAYAYHQLQGRQVDTVVLLGPSHYDWVGDHATSTEDAYETPLGVVPLDQDFINELAGSVHLRRIRGDREHSLELQLPFLQRQLDEFRLVPILLQSDDPAVARTLALALADIALRRVAEGKRVVFVASSDLHHIENYDEVVRRDRQVVDAIAAYDLDRLTSLFTTPGCSVCGRMPILTVMYAARDLGASAAKILYQTNSGDVSGLRSQGQYTVGYAAAAMYTPVSEPPAGS
jgi:AmmeMemoRadiSam system protein B